MDGQSLLLDSDADSHFTADTDDRLDLALAGTDLFRFDGTVATPVNGIDFIARATGSPATIQAQGSDSNVALDIRDDNGNELLILSAVASAVNELTIANAATGNPPSLSVTGETNVDLNLVPAGTGQVDISSGGATQAEQEAGSVTDKIVTPGRQHFHPSAAKVWVKFDLAGTMNASHNVDSISDTGTGDWTVNITTDFSSVNYAAVPGWRDDSGGLLELNVKISAQAAGTFQILMQDDGASANTDPAAGDDIHAVAFGDQ